MPAHFPSNILVVLATAPAGLGHIRVTHALKSGLSAAVNFRVMGISDASIQWIHRLTSRNPALKHLMEFVQENRLTETWFSHHYREWLSGHPHQAADELEAIIDQCHKKPKNVVVVATHFGLAYQLAAVKPILCQKLGIRMVLAVVVTDDSPQQMWAVSGVDIIFVPSNTTREVLLNHLLNQSANVPAVITIPYPVSLELKQKLADSELQQRLDQLRGKQLRLMVPVSGAAVQLDYYQQLISVVTADPVQVSVVSRDSTYTHQFIQWCRNQSGVTTIAYRDDADVVTAYEREYIFNIIGAEVTKPSEQAFKALYTPKERGGAVLLLSAPVGRQEKDNLAFLRRHRLIPSVDDQQKINQWCLYGNRLQLDPALLDRAHHWRGIMLPPNGTQAGIAIKRLIDAGILSAMGDFKGFLEGHDEIRSDGVNDVWSAIADHFSTRRM